VLPPQNRLRLARDHQRVARRGARGGATCVVVHLVTESAAEVQAAPRVGVVVSRSVGNAVTRNTVRRRLRHLMRERLDRVPAGSLVVVRARTGVGSTPTAVLAGDLDTALDRALRAPQRDIQRADLAPAPDRRLLKASRRTGGPR
jgi:ribonuclease P protein component